ncbi:hypothetical protein AGMMS50267_09740 [Spirochaetia bacterium]|nr:hypothetical protein AGMMS50267_09740 [Spirochaetia bacterium]
MKNHFYLSGRSAVRIGACLLVAVSVLFAACRQSVSPGGGGAADPKALKTAIASAEDLVNSVFSSPDGSDVSRTRQWAEQGDIDAYKGAIATAQAVVDKKSPAATQTELDQAVAVLAAATTTFNDILTANGFGTKSPVDRDGLQAQIDEAQALLDATDYSDDGEDIQPYDFWVTAGEWDDYSIAIEIATEVVYDTSATADAINAASDALDAATLVFRNVQKPGNYRDGNVYITGTLSGGIPEGIVTIYEDAAGTTLIDSATVSRGAAGWRVGIPEENIGSTVYAQVAFLGLKSALVPVTVTATGASDIDLNLAPAVPQGVNAAPWYKTVTGSVADGTAVRAVDNSITTNWAVGTSATSATLTLEFDFDITVNAIVLRNSRTDTVSRFKVEYSTDGTTWQEAYEYYNSGAFVPSSADGAGSGNVAYPMFLNAPFTAGYVRLSLIGLPGMSNRPVAIWEFELYNAFDRTALNDAITAAKAGMAGIEVSVDGADVYILDKWVTATAKTEFEAAIAAAEAVAQNPAIADATGISDAVAAFATAQTAFTPQFGTMNNNKADLRAAITAAIETRDYYKVSADSGATLYANQLWVTQANKTTYADAITAAETVRNDNSVGLSQSDVDNALATLNTATGTFTGGAQPGALVNASDTNLAPRYMKITATNENSGAQYKVPAIADGVGNTRWATASASLVYPVYVTLDFGLPITINQSVIKDFGAGPAGRLTDFEIEYWDGSAWQQAYDSPNKGTAIPGHASNGNNITSPFTCEFAANQTSSQFRLKINAASTDPTIWEWELRMRATPSTLQTFEVAGYTLEPAFVPDAATPNEFTLIVPSSAPVTLTAAVSSGVTATLGAGQDSQTITITNGTGTGTVTVTGTGEYGTSTYTLRVFVVAAPDADTGDRSLVTTGTVVPFTMKYVPAGVFQRDGTAGNLSVITRNLLVLETDVTQELFNAVTGDALAVAAPNPTDTPQMPAAALTMYKKIVFANKLSIMHGLDPVYSVGAVTDWATFAYTATPTVLATWNDLTMDITKNGYRLPTKMEHIWAAIGADTANPGKVNTTGYNKAYAGASGTAAQNAWCDGGSNPIRPVKGKAANELGLYDMSGNVWETIWDRYEESVSAGIKVDYTGPASGTNFTRMSGDRGNTANLKPTMQYTGATNWDAVGGNVGFRVVRNLD